MDIYDVICGILLYIIYPICIVFVGLEIHRYVYTHYVLIDDDDDDNDDDDDEYNESYGPTIEMCSRCKNPDCSHRIAYYLEEEDHD